MPADDTDNASDRGTHPDRVYRRQMSFLRQRSARLIPFDAPDAEPAEDAPETPANHAAQVQELRDRQKS
jgi:hypothetical protein